MIENVKVFTIVTVCYNSKKTIEKTFDSVLNQNFCNYEYIIIDGGSIDGTLDIIRKYEDLFQGRMRWISEPDKGIYDAFNKGIKLSKGSFIWIVNSDDWIEPNALAELSEDAIRYLGSLSILCANYNFYANGEIKFTSSTVTPKRLSDAYRSSTMGISHPACVYSREVYNQVGLYDERYFISGDIDHYLRCYEFKVNFILLDKTITNMSDGGISNTNNFRKALHDWKIKHGKWSKNKFIYYYRIFKQIIQYKIYYFKKYISK